MGKSRNKYRHLAGLDKHTRLLLVAGVLKDRPSDCPFPEKKIARKRKRRRAKQAVINLPASAEGPKRQKVDDEAAQKGIEAAHSNKTHESTGKKPNVELYKGPHEPKKRVSKESKANKMLDRAPNEKMSKKSPRAKAKAVDPSALEHLANVGRGSGTCAKVGSENEGIEVPDTSSRLESRFLQKLNGGYFRWINETLYKCSGEKAEQLFASDPESFKSYHIGYRAQVSRWPVNPVLLVSKWLRRKPSSWKVADMGCGDAQLATIVKNKVYSFDFLALNDRVTACNMAKVPLPDCHVQVCLFCLSLMGTNLADYLNEAFRILKPSGILIIIEILSRFNGIKVFRRAVEKLGFVFDSKMIHHSYFVWLTFRKGQKQLKKSPAGLILNPCLYKKR